MVMGRDYHREYSRKYYHRKRSEYIALLGGKCGCGSIDDLEFHHIDPNNKKHNIGRLLSFSKAEALLELKKCKLLCAKCHKTETRKQRLGS